MPVALASTATVSTAAVSPAGAEAEAVSVNIEGEKANKLAAKLVVTTNFVRRV
ncbi:hypothetical protein JCM19039_4068 [Geomicrobium sp. JCM 19039]|nr:hypothetical protein JCM19039_4068 [Geomicrobium sp. JCM 19039]